MIEIEVSWMSVLPSIVTIALAFLTRQVLVSLFAGMVAGGLVLWIQTGDIAGANIVQKFLIPTLSSGSYAKVIIIYLCCLGGILGLWDKTGSAAYFAETIGSKVAKGSRSSLIFAWFLGLIFHQGGTISTILTGTTVKPVADRYKVSHEELSYVVDSTAAPVATIIPFNIYPTFVAGLVLGTIPLITDNMDAATTYLSSLRYNFYAIFAISSTLLFSLGWLPWIGKGMAAAKIRARSTGALDSPTARPLVKGPDEERTIAEGYVPGLLSFIVPIVLLLTISITPYVLWGLGVIEAENTDFVTEAFLVAMLAAIIVAKLRGMNGRDIMEGFLSGCKEVVLGAIVLGLAFTMGTIAKELHTADFFIQMVSGTVPAIILPGILMVICMIVAFSTGTSLGTYAVVFPVAIPLAYAINVDPNYIQICFGAILGGAVFGDQCSPISDTTILSSMFTGCDLMDHVKTQLPLALVAAALGAVCSTLVAYLIIG